MSNTIIDISCSHCGQSCNQEISIDNHFFCCNGCFSVFKIIQEHGLCKYYDFEKLRNKKINRAVAGDKFTFLDNQEIIQKWVKKINEKNYAVEFRIPSLHCSSCIWLIEKLPVIEENILMARVDFERKTILVKFNEQFSLRKTVELLNSIGYPPQITNSNSLLDNKIIEEKKIFKTRLIKLGVAGFCFANIMMMSLPEYFSSKGSDPFISNLPFGWINFVLSLPVFFYCASEFYLPAIKSIRNRFLSIDIPVFIAVLVTFIRSIYELSFGISQGYFDSMSGIVFFMLVGRVLQDRLYQPVSFNKQLDEFIPVSISKINHDNSETEVPVSSLLIGDKIKLRHDEILPVDSVLISDYALMNESFISGESDPVSYQYGQMIFAGGCNSGGIAIFKVSEIMNSGYLRMIWNDSTQDKSYAYRYNNSYVHRVSKNFTFILIVLASIAFFIHSFESWQLAFNALTTVLIVACPCVLLLSHTFTYGFMLMHFQKFGIYFKNAFVIEDIAMANHIVFDKTGTILQPEKSVNWIGQNLNDFEKQIIFSLANQSSHYKSNQIAQYFKLIESTPVVNFKESRGEGVSGYIGSNFIEIGSSNFVLGANNDEFTYVKINGNLMGKFEFNTIAVPYCHEIIKQLHTRKTKISVLSGDNNRDFLFLKKIIPFGSYFWFNKKPNQKANVIKDLQEQGDKVAMIGDGINDNNALLMANVGIALTNSSTGFIPSCDVVVSNKPLSKLPALFQLAKASKRIILIAFCFALMYNSVGLYFALSGTLSPGIAAILMPLSTLTIIGISLGGVSYSIKKFMRFY